MKAIVLTRRQEEDWRKKMLEVETSMLRYYRGRPEKSPDGSFCMGAFKEGYWLRARKEREARRA